MKKLILLATVLLGAGVATAQPHKGAITVGGSLAFQTTSGSTSSFDFSPAVEYFVSDNFSVGGSLNFGSYGSTSSLGLGLGVEYYFPELTKNLYFSVGGSINFGVTGGSPTFGLGVVPALNYYFSEHISLSFSLGELTVQSSANGGNSATTFFLRASSFSSSLSFGYTF